MYSARGTRGDLPHQADGRVTLGIRQELAPGDLLFAAGARATYTYFIEHGLLQSVSTLNDRRVSPSAVSYFGPGKLVGLLDPLSQQRLDSVRAVVPTRLLAFSLQDMQALKGECPAMQGLVSRSVSSTLKHEWRTAYRLRDLPPYTRIVAGLTHLIKLARPDSSPDDTEASLAWAVEEDVFGQWLGLDADDMEACLAQLARYGAVHRHHCRLVAVNPHVVLTVSAALREHRVRQACQRLAEAA